MKVPSIKFCRNPSSGSPCGCMLTDGRTWHNFRDYAKAPKTGLLFLELWRDTAGKYDWCRSNCLETVTCGIWRCCRLLALYKVAEWVWGHGGIASTGDVQCTGTKTSLDFCTKHFWPQEVFVELSASSRQGLRIPAYKMSARRLSDLRRNWNWQQSQ
jgi:hypothetical protein